MAGVAWLARALARSDVAHTVLAALAVAIAQFASLQRFTPIAILAALAVPPFCVARTDDAASGSWIAGATVACAPCARRANFQRISKIPIGTSAKRSDEHNALVGGVIGCSLSGMTYLSQWSPSKPSGHAVQT